jgi:hypothetical protein
MTSIRHHTRKLGISFCNFFVDATNICRHENTICIETKSINFFQNVLDCQNLRNMPVDESAAKINFNITTTTATRHFPYQRKTQV